MNHYVLYRDRINSELTRHMIDSMKDLPGFGTSCMKDVNYGYVLCTRNSVVDNSGKC